MERLTEKCWRNLDPWECCGQDNFCKRGCHDKGGCANSCIVPKLYCKLAKYEDDEEQGLLLRLPCKVGDTIYYFMNVDDVIVVEERKMATLTNIVAILEDEEFGKTVFLTKEEAEQALAEMKGV